jgi:DNA primase
VIRRHYPEKTVTDTFKLKGAYGGEPVFDGTNLRACCPFPHVDQRTGKAKFEKSPSFGINLFTGSWNCFSCGKKGLSLKALGDRLGVSVPLLFRTSEASASSEPNRNLIEEYDIDSISMNQDKAAKYLESRKINPKLASIYSMGFDGNYKRVFLPIRNREGKMQAWMERNLDKKATVKALIKPDGVIKTKLIFGLYENRKKDVILVESPFDTLKLNTFGFCSIATLGASLSKLSGEEILDYYDRIIAIPQNDLPGEKWLESVSKYLATRAVVFRVDLPSEYKDVCEIDSKIEFLNILENRYILKGTKNAPKSIYKKARKQSK